MSNQYFSHGLEIFFFMIFTFMCWRSLVKYCSRERTVLIKKIDFEEKEYPSVSICPNHPFKTNLEDFMFRNDSISIKEIENLVKANSWKSEEIFYYVSYQTKSNPGYECLTTKDSVDPRKPCSFPFIWDNTCKFVGTHNTYSVFGGLYGGVSAFGSGAALFCIINSRSVELQSQEVGAKCSRRQIW